MKEYITIDGFFEDEFTEKRSTFIGAINPVSTHEEAMEFIKLRREKHYDSRHTVWAYLLKDGVARYSDDGEPQGTGGQPVLECIKRTGLVDVCIAVTRYFGGILLGAGGLTRAYSSGAAMAVKGSNTVEVSNCTSFKIPMSYNQLQIVNRILPENSAVITNTEYGEVVEVFGIIRSCDLEKLTADLTQATSGALLIDLMEEQYYKMPPKELI